MYAKLVGKIYSVCGNKSKFAEAMGMSRPTLSGKLSGKSEWKQTEIEKAVKVLEIPEAAVYAYFFTK